MSECEGKIGYPTEELALQAIAHYQSISKPGQPAPIRLYPCSRCGRFHITSKPKLGPKSEVKDFLWFLNQLMSRSSYVEQAEDSQHREGALQV